MKWLMAVYFRIGGGSCIPELLRRLKPRSASGKMSRLNALRITPGMLKARKALEMALFSSVCGDISSDVLTILFIGPIALLAMKIGPPELAAIILLSLVIISATTGSADLT